MRTKKAALVKLTLQDAILGQSSWAEVADQTITLNIDILAKGSEVQLCAVGLNFSQIWLIIFQNTMVRKFVEAESISRGAPFNNSQNLKGKQQTSEYNKNIDQSVSGAADVKIFAWVAEYPTHSHIQSISLSTAMSI